MPWNFNYGAPPTDEFGQPIDPYAPFGGYGDLAGSPEGYPGAETPPAAPQAVTQAQPTAPSMRATLDQLEQANLNEQLSLTHRPARIVNGQPVYQRGWKYLTPSARITTLLRFVQPLMQAYASQVGGPQRTKRGRFWGTLGAGGVGATAEQLTQPIAERLRAKQEAAKDLMASAAWERANMAGRYAENAPVAIQDEQGKPQVITRGEFGRRVVRGEKLIPYQKPTPETTTYTPFEGPGGIYGFNTRANRLERAGGQEPEAAPEPTLVPSHPVSVFTPWGLGPAPPVSPPSPAPAAHPAAGFRRLGANPPIPPERTPQQKYADAIERGDEKTAKLQLQIMTGIRNATQHPAAGDRSRIGTPAQFATAANRKNAGLREMEKTHKWVTDEVGTDGSPVPPYFKGTGKNKGEDFTPDEFRDRKQELQNAYEEEIANLGANFQHYEYPVIGSQEAAAPPVAPGASPTLPEGTIIRNPKTKERRQMKGGKWVPIPK
jgi:hypothetical protein